MMCDARLFGPQLAGFGGRRLHFPALTGADTVQGLATQILRDAPPRFALAGLSMGGIVAMEVMARAPERVTHLALMDTNPRAEIPEVQARRAPQIARVQAGGLEAVMRDEMKPNYLTHGPNRAAILDLCMDMARSLGPQAFVHQSCALRDRPDQQETLARVAVPTLILCGRDDMLCPVERHELMHALIPHSTLQIVENAGHMPTLEQPEITTEALRRWLEA
jgi:pimeloyl-ACP methyl ester carboxylesterase